jgi:hypothetical protein
MSEEGQREEEGEGERGEGDGERGEGDGDAFVSQKYHDEVLADLTLLLAKERREKEDALLRNEELTVRMNALTQCMEELQVGHISTERKRE